jgi:eukaryotic-like serine/threonine-protein kinase
VVTARVALTARDVAVPDLRGRSLNEASARLGELGLTLKVDQGRRFDTDVPSDRIVTQEPQGGVTARFGRSVKVWLSSGPRVNYVPPLTGFTERSATTEVEQAGLALGEVAEIRSSDYPAGIVIAQEPPARSAGNRVSLLVNRGERAATYVMPDLIGISGDRAADLLRDAGFRVAVVSEQPYPGVPPGVVLRQAPQAGFQVAPGDPISLEVSR